MNVVARAVSPAGVEHPMVPVPTFDFSSLGFIFFGAGTPFFIRLRPAFFVSHNLLSFRWWLLVTSPPAPLDAAVNLFLSQIVLEQASVG
jgi:hypothetical protein